MLCKTYPAALASCGDTEPQPALHQALLAKAPCMARSGNRNKGFAHLQQHSQDTPRLYQN